LLPIFKGDGNTINTATKIMLQSRFVDDSTIEVIAQDGEKFTCNTYFPTPMQDQEDYSKRLAHNFEKYFKDNIGDETGMGLHYWIWIQMNYFEGLAIAGGKGEKDNERIFLHKERVRIGTRIREIRKERNIEAKTLAQLINIDAANLSRIEQGRYSVGLDILSRISLALGTRIELVDFVNQEKA